MKITFTQMLY